jgi:3alpha(or 20beta)-hydroxysteroid dehydrogenase
MGMDRKAVVITGGAGGIGRATARVLAAEGARLLLVDRDEAGLREIADELAGGGAEVRTRTADVTSGEDVRGYVAEAVEAFGRIDVFFNNAGIIGSIGPLVELSEDDFDRVMAINARGVFLGLRHVLPVMVQQRSGSVINTGSLSSERGLPGTAAYNAAKHAVLGLTRSAAAEVAHLGIRVNAVLPGMIDTPMLAEVTSGFADAAGARAAAEAVSPQGRLGQPEEIAAVVAFLASDAASLVNGVGWPVDGGILGTLSTAKADA